LVQKINMIELVSPDPAMIQAQSARAHKVNQPQFVFSPRRARLPFLNRMRRPSKSNSCDALRRRILFFRSICQEADTAELSIINALVEGSGRALTPNDRLSMAKSSNVGRQIRMRTE
jgi:hypothetical protein